MPAHATFPPFASGCEQRIDALGEAELLRRIRQWLGNASPSSPEGIGDDCAVWPQPPQGAQLLFTTDAVVYGRHFDATCPPELAAAKLLKRNLSDIAAMGGTPHSALLALTLPRNLSLRWLERFYLGLRECSLHYATPITGGDITEGTDNFFAAHITLIGHAKRPLLRTGAHAGDHLFVTGALGGSIHGHHLHFEPRLPQGQWLATQPDVRALIDITDGLAKDLPPLLGRSAGASPHVEAGAASPHVEMSSGHFQAQGQRSPLAGGQGSAGVGGQGGELSEAGKHATSATAIALLNLDALPVTTAALAKGQSTVGQQALRTEGTTSTEAAGGDTLSPAIAHTLSTAHTHALSDGEDYELLFAVDSKTDPAEFIARWQAHFGQHQAPAKGTPTKPQPAYPYYIGRIGTTNSHPAGASCLYDAATGQPLQLGKGGFQHL